jgi:hypothetical protein
MPPRAPRRRSAARPAVSMANTPGRAGWLFPSLHGYSLSQLPRDAVAALILTAIAVPGQLATARLMGLPPMVGLFAFAAGSLAFAAFGANRFASVAADSTIAPIRPVPCSPWSLARPTMQRLPPSHCLSAPLFGAGLTRRWIADLPPSRSPSGFWPASQFTLSSASYRKCSAWILQPRATFWRSSCHLRGANTGQTLDTDWLWRPRLHAHRRMA